MIQAADFPFYHYSRHSIVHHPADCSFFFIYAFFVSSLNICKVLSVSLWCNRRHPNTKNDVFCVCWLFGLHTAMSITKQLQRFRLHRFSRNKKKRYPQNWENKKKRFKENHQLQILNRLVRNQSFRSCHSNLFSTLKSNEIFQNARTEGQLVHHGHRMMKCSRIFPYLNVIDLDGAVEVNTRRRTIVLRGNCRNRKV